MAIQVHSATKPTTPGKTLAVTALVFGLTCLLAVDMSRRRQRETLAPRYAPPGWGVSFRPPKRFIPAELSRTTLGAVILYSGRLPGGFGANLAVWRVENEARIDPDDLCLLILSQYQRDASISSDKPGLSLSNAGLPAPARAIMGEGNAVERFDPEQTVVVRAVARNRSGYAVSMLVSEAPIEADAYRVFDLTCKSFQFMTE